jgi:hypothetical protein
MQVTVACDSTVGETHSYSSALTDVMIRPSSGIRCKEVEVTIEETTSGGEGPIFSGLAMVLKSSGRLQNLNNASRIA